MKGAAKRLIARLLGWQVRRLRRKNEIIVVGVAGSMGKTSTKIAIATVLRQGFRVRFQEGNYNDLITVPLVFFGQENPESIINPFAWLRIFINNERQLKKPYPYDVVVVELGTDGPGQLRQFGSYLTLDIAVVTAIAPEHMEFFGHLDAVAKEELSVQSYAKKLLINKDLAGEYLPTGKHVISYGVDEGVDYRVIDKGKETKTDRLRITNRGSDFVETPYPVISNTQLYTIGSAAAVACELGLQSEAIVKGIADIKPVSGRMRQLEGIKGTTILDDTYNASPDAVKAALDALYLFSAPQRIAVLGNMNELGKHSVDSHRSVGEYCNPEFLDLVVTIGPDANEYLAAAAAEEGCRVETAKNPYEAAGMVKNHLKQGAVILAKGSQNGVFAEEAVKLLLANPDDAQHLVRQSKYWLKQKAAQFGKRSDP